jgi:hypothetical protein
MYSKDRVKLAPQSVSGRALSLGFARIHIIVQKIRLRLRYMTRGMGTNIVITVSRDEESKKSGMSEV